jgi:hypothetical protein
LCYYTSEVACPYFYPIEPRVSAAAAHDAMLPLGDSWAGVCRAIPERPGPPDEAILRPLCNLGYARGTCARFPEGDGPDAVRFAISRDAGAAIRISYVIERDHHPFAHGNLEYFPATGAVGERPGGETLERQAQAYAESYRRRKRLEA